MRTFIAIELNQETKKALSLLQEELKTAGADVNWVKPENIHLTLKFLGEVEEQKIPKINEALEKICTHTPSFAISLYETGVFPNQKFPRVVWIGIKEGKENTHELINQIENSFVSLKFAKEKREASAHITIGRVRSAKNKEALTAKLALLKVPPITQMVKTIVIVQLLEAVDECHCERPQGAKQSLKIASSLSLLAMTRLLPEAELLQTITLFKSTLSSKGPTYEKLKQLNLTKI